MKHLKQQKIESYANSFKYIIFIALNMVFETEQENTAVNIFKY